MLVIDALTYIGESIYFRSKKFTAEDLIKKMDRNGIDLAIVTAPPPGPNYQEANKTVYEAVKKYPNRLIGFYRINPWFGKVELEKAEIAVREWKFKGFMLDPRNESFYVMSPAIISIFSATAVRRQIVEPVMELASRLKVPVFFNLDDTMDLDFCTPESLALLAASYPDVTLMMRHTYLALSLALNPRLADDLKNIVFGTYPLVGGHKGVDKFLKAIGRVIDPSRVVFTTEMPFGCPELELKIIELSKLDEEIRKRIMGENIRSILKL
ncbi:MAG: amidohydrolase family protein [archaeon GB-1867-005]|nr:amidohydrolase family protein [Candidatus Culexmicrobium cathedralense]